MPTSASFSISEASFPTQSADQVVKYKERESIRNPLFQLAERPKVLDVTILDVLHVFDSDESFDPFAYRSEDYLADIRLLTETESVSLDVRIAHDLMNNWVHFIKPPTPPPAKKRKSRVFR